jgi:hypothetical protein
MEGEPNEITNNSKEIRSLPEKMQGEPREIKIKLKEILKKS